MYLSRVLDVIALTCAWTTINTGFDIFYLVVTS